MTDKLISQICNEFEINSTVESFLPWGDGHINDTYIVKLKDKSQYILQRINHNIFKDVNGLMSNIVSVCNHIHNKIVENNESLDRSYLKFISSKAGENYVVFNDNFYRLYLFIDKVSSYTVVDSTLIFKNSAIAFGRFQKYLADFDASKLTETIKDFHNTKVRFKNLLNSIDADVKNRANLIEKEIEFFRSREKLTGIVVDEIEKGNIPLKVCHNDTKVNNVLMDNETGEGLCVIDLDTVMPGSILYDFGDSIRSGCATSEDGPNQEFRIEYFKAYCEGFLAETLNTLNEKEIELLPYAGILMTFECGMRFLTDYLDGDVYFKVEDSNHNLRRARNQIRLVELMEENIEEIKNIVNNIIKELKK